MFKITFVLRILPVTSFAEGTFGFVRLVVVVEAVHVHVRFHLFVIAIARMRLFRTMERILSITRSTELANGTTLSSTTGFH